jgi:hypothetical protein
VMMPAEAAILAAATTAVGVVTSEAVTLAVAVTSVEAAVISAVAGISNYYFQGLSHAASDGCHALSS